MAGLDLNLRLTLNSNGSVTANWDSISGASYYESYMYDINSNQMVYNQKNIKTNSYTSKAGIKDNSNYRVVVVAYKSTGGSITSAGKNILIPSGFYNTSLAVPGNVRASAETNAITVSWSGVSGATSYDVLFDNVASNVTGTSKRYTGLTPNSRHSYAVRAKNQNVTGSYSTTQYINTLQSAVQYPSTPSNITKKADETSATISWGTVSNATSYELLFNGTTYSLTATSKTIYGLTPGRAYSFQVRARNANGYSAYSGSMTVTIAPNAPTGISATATSNGATIRWNSVSGASGYTVEFDGINYEVGSNQTSYTVTGKLPSINYRYRICSKSVDGPGVFSSFYYVKTLDQTLVPPSAIGHSTTETSIEIYWNMVSGASEYEILFDGRTYRASNASRSIYGLSPNKTYKYKIRSVTSNGKTSDYSTEMSATTAPGSPMPWAEIDGETITVNWQPVTGATGYRVWINNSEFTTNTNSFIYRNAAPNTTYNIKVKSRNRDGEGNYSNPISVKSGAAMIDASGIVEEIGSYEVRISWPPVEGADYYEINIDGDTSFTRNTYWQSQQFVEKTTYRYKLRAYTGNVPGPYTEERTFTTKPYAPNTPENVRATSTSDSVTVMWSADARATSYEVFFDGIEYGTTATSKTITGLNPKSAYQYKVRAKNDGGYSNYSWPQTIVTKAPVPATPTDVSATSTIDSVTISFSPIEEADDYDIVFDNDVFKVNKDRRLVSKTPKSLVKSANRAVLKAAATPEEPKKMKLLLKGLKPDSTHNYQARANNESGSSDFSPLSTIVTKKEKMATFPERRTKKPYLDGRYGYTGHDPINVISGAFLWDYTILEEKGKDGLGFTLMYDSERTLEDRGVGKKWTHSLNYVLTSDENHVYFITPYDNVYAFDKNNADGTFTPVSGGRECSLSRGDNGTYLVRCGEDAEYIFDGDMSLKQINEDGIETYTFIKDTTNNTVKVESAHGAYLTLTYMDGHIRIVTAPDGNRYIIGYESNGDIFAIYNKNIKPIRFEYDNNSNIIAIRDYSGNTYLTNTYDLAQRVIEQVITGRGKSKVLYNDEACKNTFIDAYGYSTIYTYDELGNVTDIEQGDSHVQNRYNAKNQLIESIDSLGNSTMMGYDDRGRMNRVVYPDRTDEKITYADNNKPTKVISRDGSEVNYQYDERNNLIEATDERGNVSSYTYDENDNLITYTDRLGNTWNFEYDEANHLKKAIDPKGNKSHYTHDEVGRLTSFTSPLGNKVEHIFSEMGELVEIKDKDGSVTYEYDVNGNPVKIVDRRGNDERIDYNDMGQVILVRDRAGATTTYEYDSCGRLISERDVAGYETFQNYDEHGNVAFIRDKEGSTTSFTYDANNRLIKVEDELGGTIEYTYDCMGQVTSVKDQLSRERTFEYDNAGNVLKETDPLGNDVSYTYDVAGNLLTRTDEDGVVTSYTYDGENRVKTIETADGETEFTYDELGRVISVKDAEGHVESAEYDADGNPVISKDKEEHETTFEYDHAGRIVKETLANGAETLYEYDANGNCVKKTDALGNLYTYEYDEENRLKKTTDPLGHTTSIVYDSRGQVSKLTDANENVWKYAYNGSGTLRCEISPTDDSKIFKYDELNRLKSVTDEAENTAEYTYDAVGNCTSYKDFNGNTLRYEWDANNRLIKVTNDNEAETVFEYTGTGLVSKVTDAEGAQTLYEYDSLGRVTKISDALGHNTVFIYDKLGRVLTETDANGNTTEYEYSPVGNLLKVTRPEGDFIEYSYDEVGNIITEENAAGTKLTYTRDALGQVIKVTDALNNETEFTYTADGKIATVKNSEGRVTSYAYDPNGNLTEITDAYGNVTHYEYDSINNLLKEYMTDSEETKGNTIYQYDSKSRKIKEINPLLEEQTFEYDGNGNTTAIVDEEGRWTQVIYDLNNRPIELKQGFVTKATLRYNKRGELVELKDWTGTTSYERDALGRVTKVTNPEGKEAGYSYDAVGNRIGIAYPDGSNVSFEYDRNNRIKKITDGEDVVAQYTYDTAGRIGSIVKADGIAKTYTYDLMGRPTGISYMKGESPIAEEAFTFDCLGRITSSNRTSDIEGLARIAEYGYDALGRLTSYLANGDTLENYLYDSLGNRLAIVLNGNVNTSYSYDAANRLTSLTENGITTGFEYDKCGNLIKENRNDELIRQYLYNMDNLLTKGLNLETGEETEYSYNAFKELIKTNRKLKTGEDYRSVERKFVPDFMTSHIGNNLMMYETGKGSLKTIFGNGYERVSQKFTPEVPTQTEGISNTFFHNDLYLSPMIATDNQGNIIAKSSHGIWGERLDSDLPETLDENLRFTSYRYDPVISKYHGNARIYDPRSGRMQAVDPVNRGLNRYTYCDDDPVNYVDPDGEIPTAVIGGITGAIFGFGRGFVGSVLGQAISGDEINFREAVGEGFYGAVTDGVRGTLIGSGLGMFKLGVIDGAAGALGSIAKQLYVNGEIDGAELVKDTGRNIVNGMVYGSNDILTRRTAAKKGAAAIGLMSALNYLTDFEVGRYRRNKMGGIVDGFAIGVDAGGNALSAEESVSRDPRRTCGDSNPFETGVLSKNSRGYGSALQRVRVNRASQNKFSVGKFAAVVALDSVLGAIESSVAFDASRAANKGIGRLKAYKNQNKVDFYVYENGETVPSTGYRYVSDKAKYLNSMRKTMTIPANKEGTYFSYDRYDIASPGKLQVPHDASIRTEFNTYQILDDIEIPHGEWGKANFLEPITSSFPQFGEGGATQAVTHSKIKLKSITKIKK